ncbi:hypothetical protein PI125_g12614 [Phytophthora idaei]|nr:hypothetical protein PI125_g12614 [Phytophthora idaei]KAG3144395.1 hypothetical protein PI126_g14192 [Phytophthora idaei]
MLELKVAEAEADLAMREGCIDRLTVIRRCDISFRGIRDVRRMIKRDCGDQATSYSKENWKKFWKYFKKTWVKKGLPEWWNVNGLHDDIVNRTNNPLERYNRTLNDAFSVRHPDVIQFINVIEEQSRENARLVNDISIRRATAPAHAEPQQAPRFESESDIASESVSDLDDSDDSNSEDDSENSMSPEY